MCSELRILMSSFYGLMGGDFKLIPLPVQTLVHLLKQTMDSVPTPPPHNFKSKNPPLKKNVPGSPEVF